MTSINSSVILKGFHIEVTDQAYNQHIIGGYVIKFFAAELKQDVEKVRKA